MIDSEKAVKNSSFHEQIPIYNRTIKKLKPNKTILNKGVC